MSEDGLISQKEMITIIRPPRGWFYLNLKELWDYRELAYFFVWRDFKIRYKQTVIGALWAIFQPFFAMVVFSIFFGKFIKVPSDGIPYPVFVYTGLILWTYFSFGLTHASNSMIENANIIRKIYFPRLIIPIASSLTGLVDLFFSSLVLVGIMSYYHYLPRLELLLVLPLLVLMTFFISVGLGCYFASLNVKYRDVRYVLPYFIQMGIFITPVLYPVKILGEKFSWLLALNPMSSIIETARFIFFGKPSFNISLVSISFFVSLLVFFIGIVYFRKTERFFADII